jgi:3-hydroxybutyryl-CoA dehydrogenase
MTDLSNITVGVLGAGTMGQGIAQVCASSGCKVILYDVRAEALPGALDKIAGSFDQLIQKGKLTTEQKDHYLKNITTEKTLQAITADFIIEAAVEDLEVKQKIFSEVERVVPKHSILLTNTSSIQVSRIGQVLKNPERFAGMHFFNPASVMKLVEVVQGSSTSTDTVEKVKEFSIAIGKLPVIAQDSPGFIVNRVARLYYVEALKILEEGVSDHESIDNLLRNAGFRMGPFELMDLIGIDVNLSVTKSIFEAFNYESRFRPSQIQQQKVDSGWLGRKSGKGFYDYRKDV